MFSRTPIKSILCIIAVTLLAGCAARSEKMVPEVRQAIASRGDAQLHDGITLVGVSGGERENVSNEEFGNALTAALQAHGYFSSSPSNAPYRLKALIVELRYPLAGFTTTVDSFVRYTLSRSADDGVVFDEIVHTADTKTIGDEFVGLARHRIAVEGAMRASIAALLARLESL